jgi:hypothetical protein
VQQSGSFKFFQNVGSNATAANNSNFFGENAGYSATTANNSNFFGREAGYLATSYQLKFHGSKCW